MVKGGGGLVVGRGRRHSISLMLSVPCTSTGRAKCLAHLVEVEGGNTQAFYHPGEYPVAMVRLDTGGHSKQQCAEWEGKGRGGEGRGVRVPV